MNGRVVHSAYYDVLASLHDALEPTTYLEIGVAAGESLSLAHADTLCIGVDPDPSPDERQAFRKIRKLLQAPRRPGRRSVPRPEALGLPNVTFFEEDSDRFFATHDLDALLQGRPLDLAFMDGMHLFEFALRDFTNIEARSCAHTVVAVHDCLPFDAATSSRRRSTNLWTGDVWKLVTCLRKHRPGLDIALIDAAPSGLCIISGLDRHDRTLQESYQRLVDDYVPLGWDFYRSEMAGQTVHSTESAVEVVERLAHLRRPATG